MVSKYLPYCVTNTPTSPLAASVNICTVVPRYIAPRYIATLAYRHEIVKNGFPPMLIPPL